MILNCRIDGIKGLFYIASQLLGAALAGLFLKAILHAHPEICSSAPFLGACDLSGVGFKGGTLIEAVTTFFLVSSIYGTAVDARGFGATAPIAIGLTITLSILATGPLTGAALNPARAFGPAVATGHWANWFVYWIGPAAGACAASLLHENLFLEIKK
jgi:glycerol uptake facilitator-like aquaporin